LDQVAGLFPASSGQCGPYATDRSISSIGALLPIALPTLDDDLGLAQSVEDLAVEQLIAKAGVEALDVAVLPRTA
jgi:hypothetical protein